MSRPRKLPDGLRRRNGTYHADFCAGGRRIRKKLSRQLDVAIDLLHELQARADRSDFGLLDNDCQLSELKDQCLRHCGQSLKPSTTERCTLCLDTILPRLSANRVSQIAVNNILTYRDE